ncbi:MAG: Rrf2 family transcriptional regulator [Rhodospirillales bacterium]|nr:Rrf2 family transcriptional regulator [Rhodospirillales bacterium]
MKLQIASQLAIFAILELAAAPEKQLSVVEISERFGVSPHHLAKVMHTLGRASFVRAVRGVGGGYQFSGNARRMTLLDIVQLFEDIADRGGRDGLGEGTKAGQALGQVLDEIDDIARATLGSITVATMLSLVRRQQDSAVPLSDEVAANA